MQPWFATLIKYKDRTRTCIEADIKTSLQEQNLFIQCRITVFWLVSSSKRFKRIATEGGIRLKKNLAIIQESSITCIRSNCNLHISCPDINLLLPTMESLFIHCAIMPFSKRCYFIAGGIGARSKKIRKASGIYFYKILQKFQKFSLLLFLFPPFLSLIDSSKKKNHKRSRRWKKIEETRDKNSNPAFQVYIDLALHNRVVRFFRDFIFIRITFRFSKYYEKKFNTISQRGINNIK